MEKYQLYRTALDAIRFLATSEIGMSEDELLTLNTMYLTILGEMKDEFSDSSKK